MPIYWHIALRVYSPCANILTLRVSSVNCEFLCFETVSGYIFLVNIHNLSVALLNNCVLLVMVACRSLSEGYHKHEQSGPGLLLVSGLGLALGQSSFAFTNFKKGFNSSLKLYS